VIKYLGFGDVIAFEGMDEAVTFSVDDKLYALGFVHDTNGEDSLFVFERERERTYWWTIMQFPICSIKEVIAIIPHEDYIKALLRNNRIAMYIRAKGLK